MLFLETCRKDSFVLLNNIVCQLLMYSSTKTHYRLKHGDNVSFPCHLFSSHSYSCLIIASFRFPDWCKFTLGRKKISMGEGGHLAMFLLMVVIESLAKKEKERSRDYLLTIRSQWVIGVDNDRTRVHYKGIVTTLMNMVAMLFEVTSQPAVLGSWLTEAHNWIIDCLTWSERRN